MQKKWVRVLGVALLCAMVALCGCGQQKAEPVLPDGVYQAKFDTDSGMFHVNEAYDGMGVLTVENGQMTIHVTLVSKNILQLYAGTAEDAKKDGAIHLEPTEDAVTYADGYSETVYGFDIPVPYLDEEFDVALIGKKGVWYDHKVSVSNVTELPEPVADQNQLADGTYQVEVTLGGGSGRATVVSPCTVQVENGQATATIIWSSSKYDYMLVGGEKYEPITTEPGSTFEIPISQWDTELDVVGDTIAMSEPHEISYTLYFDKATAVVTP